MFGETLEVMSGLGGINKGSFHGVDETIDSNTNVAEILVGACWHEGETVCNIVSERNLYKFAHQRRRRSEPPTCLGTWCVSSLRDAP